MAKKNIELIHLDCFAGPGGICTGFKASGYRTIVAIEKVGYASAVIKHFIWS